MKKYYFSIMAAAGVMTPRSKRRTAALPCVRAERSNLLGMQIFCTFVQKLIPLRSIVMTRLFSNMLYKLLIITALGTAAAAQAQTHTQSVRGRIVEKTTTEPIVGASVILVLPNGSAMNAQTDSRGEFKIERVPVGRYNLTAQMLGMTPFTANNILVNSGKETYVEMAMTESLIALEDVVVKPKVDKDQPLNKMAAVSARMLSPDEANRYAGSWGDPARMASGFAGVLVANDTRNDIIIRGNSSVGLLWRLDGFEIFNPNHFGASGASGGSLTMLNNNQLANSDFYTGAFPAEFGSATSGVFDLRLRNGNNQKHEFLAAIGYNGFELGAEGPISKNGGSYMVNARYSFTQFFLTDVTNGAIPNYQDLCAKINLPLKSGNLSVLTLAGHSNIKIGGADFENTEVGWKEDDYGQEINMENMQYFVGANYTHRFSQNTRLENRLSYQEFMGNLKLHLMPYPYADRRYPYVFMEDNEGTAGVMSTLHHRINSRNAIQAGIGADIFMTRFNDVYYGAPVDTITENYNDNTPHTSALIKGYAQWQRRLSDDISFTAGLHSDFYTFSREFTAEPRAGVKWAITPRSSLNAGTGLHSQIQPKQVYFHSPQQGVYPNHRLRSSKSWQSVLGYDFKVNANLRIKTEVYFQYLFDVPVRPDQPAQAIINLADDFFHDWNYPFVNEGTGKNYGLELTLERFFNDGYYFLVTGSLYNSRYTALDGIERNTRFNGNYALNALGGYEWKLWDRNLLSVNVKVSYLGNKRILEKRVESANQQSQYNYTNAYEKQMSPYFRTDLDVNLKTNYRRFAVEYYVGVWNITNHQNIFMQEYNENRKRTETSYQQGLMPMGGVKVFFNI